MTEDIENGNTIVESDIEPILKSSSTEGQIRELSSSKKWAVIGGILALTSSLFFTFYGLLIKKFHMDFVDILFLRSLIQTPLLILFVKIRRRNLFVLEFSEDTTSVERLKKYCVLIGQGVLAGLNMMCSYLGVLYIPLGDALTIIYTAPIFTMIFSYIFLRTRQGFWKISLAILLMIGVILIIRPPFIFPQNAPKLQFHQQSKKTNQTFMAGENNSRMEIETFYWMGVAMSLGASCIGGLMNVSINYLKEVDSGTVYFWNGLMSIFCSFAFLTFDQNSQIFFNMKNVDLETVGKLAALASIGICSNWMSTISYQLLDPTFCAVLRSQEVIFAYIAQMIVFHVIPCNISFIGAFLVLLSAVCMPLEKFVKPRLPERIRFLF